MVCTKKPLLVFIVESRGFFGSANNATCLDNAFVCIQSLHLRIPPRVLHFSAIHWYCKSFDCYLFVQATLAADTSLHCHIISHWPVFDLTVVSANTIIQHQIIQCWSVCNLQTSNYVVPRATATPTDPTSHHSPRNSLDSPDFNSFIACIILSCIILHSFKHTHTNTHTHTQRQQLLIA